MLIKEAVVEVFQVSEKKEKDFGKTPNIMIRKSFFFRIFELLVLLR